MQWFTFSFGHREYCYLGLPKYIVFVIFQNVFVESISWKQSRHSVCLMSEGTLRSLGEKNVAKSILFEIFAILT